MEKMSVAQARKVESVGREVRLQGWVRTRRDSKAGFSFLELNDGSSQGNVQVIAGSDLGNYEPEVKKLPTGASVTVDPTGTSTSMMSVAPRLLIFVAVACVWKGWPDWSCPSTSNGNSTGTLGLRGR